MINEVWTQLISELDLPGDVEKELPDLEEALDEDEIDQFNRRLREEEESARRALKKRLQEILEKEAFRMRQRMGSLQKGINDLSIPVQKEEEIHETVGSNLSTVRRACNQNKSAFVRRELSRSIARSTYVKLETGDSASIRMNTLEDVANALETDARLLMHDQPFFQALNSFLARLDDWRDEEHNELHRPIKEAVGSALDSRERRQLDQLLQEEGPKVTPSKMTHLSRLPPLDDSDLDTPGARLGVLVGWKRGQLPENERSPFWEVQTPISGEDYDSSPSEYPPVAGRIIGAVLIGYFGYYLSQAQSDTEDLKRLGNVMSNPFSECLCPECGSTTLNHEKERDFVKCADCGYANVRAAFRGAWERAK